MLTTINNRARTIQMNVNYQKQLNVTLHFEVSEPHWMELNHRTASRTDNSQQGQRNINEEVETFIIQRKGLKTVDLMMLI
jgi:hypothetical protein